MYFVLLDIENINSKALRELENSGTKMSVFCVFKHVSDVVETE